MSPEIDICVRYIMREYDYNRVDIIDTVERSISMENAVSSRECWVIRIHSRHGEDDPGVCRFWLPG